MPLKCSSAGRSRTQRSLACGQRGWNEQPRWRVQRVRHLALHRRAGAPGHARCRESHRAACACTGWRGVRNSVCLVGPFDQSPEVHHADLVADVPHDGQVVRDEQIGQAALALQVFHDVQHLCLHRHVERRGRLVAHQKLRLRGQRARDRNALPLAAGELMRKLHACRPPPAPPAAASSPLGRQGAAAIGCQRVLAQRLGNDVVHGPARIQAGVRILKDHLDAPAQRAAGVAAPRGLRVLAVETNHALASARTDPPACARRCSCRSPTRRPAPACGPFGC